MRIINIFQRLAAQRRLDSAREKYLKRIDELEDKFIKKLLLHANNCAYYDAAEMFGEIARREGGGAFQLSERGYVALAYAHTARFLFDHIDKVDGGRLILAFESVYGDVEELKGRAFARAVCLEKSSPSTLSYIDEFLRDSYNSFMESLTCVIPLESSGLIGRA
jgi:hypothetical protein